MKITFIVYSQVSTLWDANAKDRLTSLCTERTLEIFGSADASTIKQARRNLLKITWKKTDALPTERFLGEVFLFQKRQTVSIGITKTEKNVSYEFNSTIFRAYL